jgi:arylsulfatase A-like enzyme
MVQSVPQYRNKTTLLFATDHGRGEGARWTTHGEKVPEAKNVWFVAAGPDTPGTGEQRNGVVAQNQIAATAAALLGEDFQSAFPLSGKPITDVVGH